MCPFLYVVRVRVHETRVRTDTNCGGICRLPEDSSRRMKRTVCTASWLKRKERKADEADEMKTKDPSVELEILVGRPDRVPGDRREPGESRGRS